MQMVVQAVHSNPAPGTAPKHVLLTGPAGIGKSFICKAIPAYLRITGQPVLWQHADMFGAQNVHSLLKVLRKDLKLPQVCLHDCEGGGGCTLSCLGLAQRVVEAATAMYGDLEPWLDALGIDEVPPIWANREAQGGEPTAYACRDFTCSPPQTDLDAALEWLADR